MLLAGGKNMFKVNNKNVLLSLFLVDPFHATGLFLYSLMLSGGTERDKWHEMGDNEEIKLKTTTMSLSRFQW